MSSPLALARRVMLAGLLGLGLVAVAQADEPVNANGAPNAFVQAVGDNALQAIKQAHVKQGDVAKINQIVDQYVLPYVDMKKTTRLSAGRYWRQATPKQQAELVNAFKGTLIRTYSGAFTKVDPTSKLEVLPFRGDPKADDLAVRSTLTQTNSPSINIDYRLEKTAQGWKIYDLNVEGIWLIQNYRNQFAEQITSNGIDGLIQALNNQNK
ncbi:MAG TPA: ABC transporter substrate-binding protein [Burkholderiaceae bacterium]|nr:ABC transporter substrate-binding protein [Burkholderiaceae bacterium]